MTYKTKLAIAVAICLWASAFVGIRAGLQDYSPEGLALLRFLIASLCMGLIYFRMPVRSGMRIKDMCGLLGVGAVGIGVYNLTLNHGEMSISSGMASFITSQAPVITTLFAVLFLGEEIRLSRILGLFISICGVALITLGERGSFTWDASITYILVATLVAGLYSALQKPFLKRYHAIETTTFIIWGATLFLSIYFSDLSHDLLHASVKTTLMVGYLGIFPAAIAYVAWSYALSEIPVSRAVSFLYFMPFLATLMGWFFLGEVPVMLSMAGGILAIAGVWIINASYRASGIKSA
ncbi:hypothetical protein AQUSIP_13450 [Aquicella siphonis]|uniref:EamA domain-containing protein n=1 Tax=Aquicella siphonis TaxID=254247 RepID=A0A5E4PI29_9COXI|nr:DMT family transporter [Aquicella siphonis]VVC76043.1 hypothetical protein AQUSIP_13450 [Aquicella siphonis]